MKVISVFLRILSTLSLLGLVAVLWLKWDTNNSQSHAFLDETSENAYAILQSAKEAQWKDISNKMTIVSDVFEANEQISPDDDNPLEQAIIALRKSEDKIFRNTDYRDGLESLYKQYGAESLIWDPESKQWKENPSKKLEAPAGFKDPFEDEIKFPKFDTKNEDGTITLGVSRQNRLRTVVGMLYKDRHDRFTEINKFRTMLVNRDVELREFQYLFAREQDERKKFEDQATDLTVKLKGVEADLEREQNEAAAYKEASTTQMGVLEDQVAQLQQTQQDEQKQYEATLQQNNEDHKRELSKANAALVKEYNRGRDDATTELLAKQSGGQAIDEDKKTKANPFIVKVDAPPVLSQSEIIAVNQSSKISEIGAPSTISRIDSKTGMILLPLGVERGVEQGNVFTLWKDQQKAARIRVQSSQNGFLLAYILPHFGTPNKLRPGDNIHVVPDEEKL
ncbi:MAG: hypothetical protein P8N49_05530 [Opitutales bacterium]|nr:hypothetical protein [Opitutales bacterium]